MVWMHELTALVFRFLPSGSVDSIRRSNFTRVQVPKIGLGTIFESFHEHPRFRLARCPLGTCRFHLNSLRGPCEANQSERISVQLFIAAVNRFKS